jgi:hypothetical protein
MGHQGDSVEKRDCKAKTTAILVVESKPTTSHLGRTDVEAALG